MSSFLPSFHIVVLSTLYRKPPYPVFSAGPQPQPPEPSVPCRTSTATARSSALNVPCRTSTYAQCSLPDLNREIERQKICQKEYPKACQKECQKEYQEIFQKECRVPDRMSEDLSENIQVEPGKPGAEVSKGKNYRPKKEFAYRMCTGWPTTAMPKPGFLSERVFSRSMVVMWWPVLMWLVAGWDEVMVAYATSFTMRGATGIALQPHQILRLPRKTTLMIDLRHIAQ